MRTSRAGRRIAAVGVLLAGAMLLVVMGSERARAEDDPFAGGADALAVSAGDASSSLRAKKKLRKMQPDMVMVRVTAVDDSKFPECIVVAKVLKAAKSKDKHFKLLGKGKTYRFAPVLEREGRCKCGSKGVDLAHEMTQNNLGGCYFPKKTKLVIKVSGVDRKRKVFEAAEIYVK